MNLAGHRDRRLSENYFEPCRLHHLFPVPKINGQTPITAILATHFVHEFIVNVMSRMD